MNTVGCLFKAINFVNKVKKEFVEVIFMKRYCAHAITLYNARKLTHTTRQATCGCHE